MSVRIDGFRRAMTAALDGPSVKDVEWSTFGHDFNVKPVVVTTVSDGISINGGDGHHLSHRRRYRPDDQVYYSCRVTRDGAVEDLKVNVESTWDVLREWFETAGKIVGVASIIAGKVDDGSSLEPTPSSTALLDGSWKGDAEFLIANVIAVAALRHMPTLGKAPQPEFATMTAVVNPAILARFHEARTRLAQQ